MKEEQKAKGYEVSFDEKTGEFSIHGSLPIDIKIKTGNYAYKKADNYEETFLGVCFSIDACDRIITTFEQQKKTGLGTTLNKSFIDKVRTAKFIFQEVAGMYANSIKNSYTKLFEEEKGKIEAEKNTPIS